MKIIFSSLVFCLFTHFANAQYYQMIHLGSLGGNAWPRAINNLGEVVGTSQTIPGDWNSAHAFLYSVGSIIDLYPYGVGKDAKDINDRSEVIGTGDYLYRKGESTYVGGYLRAINNYGVVLGSSLPYGEYFIYSFGSKTNLNIPQYFYLSDINWTSPTSVDI